MVFYFTATGNSLYAAQGLQSAVGGDLVSIPQAVQEKRFEYGLKAGEGLAIVYPVFFFGLPHIVRGFASRLRVTGEGAKLAVLLATCGSTTGTANEQLERLLAPNGIETAYKFGLPMPDNYIVLYNLPAQEKQDRLLEEAEPRLEEAAALVRKGQPGDYNQCKGPSPALASPVVGAMYSGKTAKFYADANCTGCGLCAKICPVQAIALQKGSPVWQKPRCEQCLACIHRCPEAAIQYGKKTAARGRYTNPNVRLKNSVF